KLACESGNDLADQHDAELQLSDFDDQRLVTEIRRINGERGVFRRRRIDAQSRRVLAAERLSRERDDAVVIDGGGILVDRGRRDEQEIAGGGGAERGALCLP